MTSTVALPVVPDNFLTLLAGLGRDFVGSDAFAPLLSQATSSIGVKGLEGVQSNEVPFLQAVQAAAKAQGGNGSPLVQAFAQMPLNPARTQTVLQRFSSAPPALQPSLMVLDHLEMRLNSVGESLGGIESADELTHLLQTKLNVPEAQANLWGKAGAEALAQLVIAIEEAGKPKAQGHFFNSDLRLSAERTTQLNKPAKANPYGHADLSAALAALEKLEAQSTPEMKNEGQAVPPEKALREKHGANIAEPNIPQEFLEKPVEEVAMTIAEKAAAVLKELAPDPVPPVEATGALAQVRVDVAQVQKQVQHTTQDTPHIFEAAKISDLLAEDAEPTQTPEPVTAARKPQAAPQALRWQQTVQGFDVVQELKTAEVEEILTQKSEASAPIYAAPEGEGVDLPNQVQHAVVNQKAAHFKPNFTEQVEAPFKMLIKQGGGSIRLRLNPAELGHVDIQLDIHNGQVTGRIVAQNPEVLEHLARDLHSLKQGLAESGLSLGEEGIVLLSDGDTQSREQPQQQGAKQAKSTAQDAAEEQDSATARWQAADRLIDVNV
jgi:flagellar hook-length control protein FliK